MNLFEKIRLSSSLNSILLLVAGILLVRNPVGTTQMLLSVAGMVIIISGIFDITRYFSARGYAFLGGSLLFGVMKVIMGLYLCSHTLMLVRFVSIVIGLFVLVCGINSLENALRLKYQDVPGWLFSVVMASVVVFVSVMMIFRPFSAVSATVKLAGWVLVVEGVADLIALWRMREID